MNRVKEHCADSRNECPVIRFIEDVLQVKLLPYQKLLVTHVFETNECKRINLCSDCRTKMEKKMEETINRQAAIDAISCDITITGRRNAEIVAETIGTFVDRIKALPPAEPKRGKWVDDGDPLMLTCGNCGYAVMRYNNTPFCPNCGADMREGE